MQKRQNYAQFRFFGSLNDFFIPQRKNRWFRFWFKGHPAVKDSIEAIGIPHTEIDCIFVNDQSVGFYHQIKQGDRVSVYPSHFRGKTKKIKHLKAKFLKYPRFVLDAHLGKLARNLRLLGFNTFYRKDYSDEEIIRLAREYRRIVLTRDIGLLKNKIVKRGYWVRSTDPKKQIKEIIREFNLKNTIDPFSLCLECNGKIIHVKKSKIAHQLPPKTKEYYRRFYICKNCKKIYWQGSHYKWLSGFVKDARMI